MEDKSKRENFTHNTINNHSKNYLNSLKNTIFYSNADFPPLNLVKNPLLEIEIESLLSVSTTLILFKAKSYYKKVLINLNSQNLLCSELPEILDSKIYFVFDFDLLSLSVTLDKRKKKFRIFILGSEKVFRFKATTLEIFDKFLTSLNFFLSRRRGSQENLLRVSMIPNFHKVLTQLKKTFFIESEGLNSKTKSGDIILFKSRGVKAKLQRIFTRSRFGKDFEITD